MAAVGTAQVRALVACFLRNVPVLDGGGRGATPFSQRGIYDQLIVAAKR